MSKTNKIFLTLALFVGAMLAMSELWWPEFLDQSDMIKFAASIGILWGCSLVFGMLTAGKSEEPDKASKDEKPES